MFKSHLSFLLCATLVSAGGSLPVASFAQNGLLPKPLQATAAKDNPVVQSNTIYGSISSSLRDAVAMGVKTNPEYKGIRASLRATDEELRQGRALYYPSVDFNADTGYENTDDVTSRNRISSDDDIDLIRSQASLTLTQMLFDGFEAKYEVERQKARVNSSVHRVTETQEGVALAVVEAYLDVLRQRYLVSISDENIQDHKDILDQINSGVIAGRSTHADLEQAQARLAAAEASLATTVEDLEVAESKYYREVGTEAGALIMPTVPYAMLKPTLKEEIRYSLSNSPMLKVASSDIEVAFAEAQGTREGYYPDVDLQLSANYQDDVAGVETYEKNASALMVMNWNLYRGGADVSREREFRYRHEQAKANYSNTARGLEDEVRKTWSAMIAASTRADKFDQQARANTEVAKAYKDQFTLSRRTLLDVLDSQNELFTSKVNKINSEFVQIFSVYRMLSLRGELMAAVGVDGAEYGAHYTEIVAWDEADKLRAR